jgi:hypothetical protein
VSTTGLMPLPELAGVFYGQWDPDHVGRGDCVPTSAKMLLRFYTGEEIPIGQLRRDMDLAPDGILDLSEDSGITLEACRLVLGDYGVPASAMYARDLDFDQLLGFVRRGELPIIFELHGDLSGRQDQAFGGLHAVWLVGINGDQAELRDPDRWGPHKADRWLVPLFELRRAWDHGAELGGGAVIPTAPRKGWEDDMAFTDEDRRRLGVIYEAVAPGDDGQSLFTKTNDAVAAVDVAITRLQRKVDTERGGPDGSFDPTRPAIDTRVNNP